MFFYLFSGYINIFRYLTFRGIAAAFTSFLLVLFIAPKIIEWLRELKFGQQIRNEGPQSHIVKNGTPTMGGIFMWGAVLVSTLLWASWNSFVLIVCLSVILFGCIGFVDDYAKIKQQNTKGLSPRQKIFFQILSAFILLFLVYQIPQYHFESKFGTLELVDSQNQIIKSYIIDITSDGEWYFETPSLHEDESYTLRTEIYNPEIGRVIPVNLVSITGAVSKHHKVSSKVLYNNRHIVSNQISYIETDIDNNILQDKTVTNRSVFKAKLFNAQFVPYYSKVVWYWPAVLAILFFIFIIIGFSNASNLSDGLDGLAAGMGITLYFPFGIFAYLTGHAILSSYLLLPYIAGVGELSIFIAAALGAFSGFLWYNVHPAEIFMGDTGSLPMGASIALIAIILKQELLLVIAGFMFILETLSVIIQVIYFKKYKKRVFKMAPVHHHFELSGWKENQVVIRFWMMSAFCAMIALASIKIR
ncbi:MAG: phospho-N-acetylmuramoyl-pentapeptide-transferase [Brevinemataceae bacterium]